MHQHVAEFKRQREQQQDSRTLYRIVIGLVVAVMLFFSAHVLEFYATKYQTVHELKEERIIKSYTTNSKWDVFPRLPPGQKPKFGIVMGGTSNMFEEHQEMKLGMMSTCINRLYALKMNYAFKVVKRLEDASNRTYGSCSSKSSMTPWNKIILVKEFLMDVEHVLWIDMDAVIVRTTVPISKILNVSNKVVSELGEWLGTKNYMKNKHKNRTKLYGTSDEPFFWASQDINPKYWINMNSAVFVIKNTPLAFEFLSDVWTVGDNPDSFKKHDGGWKTKTPCQGYYGWPWEQGAIWDVLSNESLNMDYWSGTILLPNEGTVALNSVTDQSFLRHIGTPFILHGKRIVQNHLYYGKFLLRFMGIGPKNLEIHCPMVYTRRHLFKNITKEQKEILRYEFEK